MSKGRSDASTSTEEVKGRPLCLFYFTHPFGVLSPEPPTITAAPPNIARTFVNMEPVPPYWSSSSAGYDTSSSRPSFDLGNATVHRNPISLARNYGLDFRRDSLSSSLFSSDMWFSSSGSSRRCEERRVLPYNRILPPLQLPMPRDIGYNLDSASEVWPTKCVNPEKFSLPPIEMPCAEVGDAVSESAGRRTKVLGVRKPRKRVHRSGLRRMMTHLMRRSIQEYRNQRYARTMEAIVEKCPPLNKCCYCISLRVGVIIIAVIGILWSGSFIFGFTSSGTKFLTDEGFPKSFEEAAQYIHLVIGIILCLIHILLLIAALYESTSLLDLFLWFSLIMFIVIAIYAILICVLAALANSLVFGLVFLAGMVVKLLLWLYCLVIVANYRSSLP